MFGKTVARLYARALLDRSRRIDGSWSGSRGLESHELGKQLLWRAGLFIDDEVSHTGHRCCGPGCTRRRQQFPAERSAHGSTLSGWQPSMSDNTPAIDALRI